MLSQGRGRKGAPRIGLCPSSRAGCRGAAGSTVAPSLAWSIERARPGAPACGRPDSVPPTRAGQRPRSEWMAPASSVMVTEAGDITGRHRPRCCKTPCWPGLGSQARQTTVETLDTESGELAPTRVRPGDRDPRGRRELHPPALVEAAWHYRHPPGAWADARAPTAPSRPASSTSRGAASSGSTLPPDLHLERRESPVSSSARPRELLRFRRETRQVRPSPTAIEEGSCAVRSDDVTQDEYEEPSRFHARLSRKRTEPRCESGSWRTGGGLSTPTQAGAAAKVCRWSFSRLWVAAIRRHSERAAPRPLRLKRWIRRLALIWAKTGSTMHWRLA
jgi:hypothetical protein